MKSILLVTPLYPIPYPENNATDVCHSFAKEWVKLGYNVQVIHFQPVHCYAWHMLIRLFGKQITNMVGGGNFYAKRLKHSEEYIMDDVPVLRIPVYNFIPHGRFPGKSVERFVKEVCSFLKIKGFVPDVITGHMMPLEVLPLLKERLNVRICMVEHGIPKKLKERYPDYRELISSYDLYGFRSEDIQKRFRTEIYPVPDTFVCYSGVPSLYLKNRKERTFDSSLRSFLFVGDFIHRKYPAAIIPALKKAYPDGNFSISFIGDGPELEEIKRSARGVEDRIRFVGRIPRERIMDYYDSADCMIMISEKEAFGLVYLESMARGCITIASLREGMDGVIINGENGFLCEAGNSEELADVIQRINLMSPEQRRKVSVAAARTAENLSDMAVARTYADTLLYNV